MAREKTRAGRALLQHVPWGHCRPTDVARPRRTKANGRPAQGNYHVHLASEGAGGSPGREGILEESSRGEVEKKCSNFAEVMREAVEIWLLKSEVDCQLFEVVLSCLKKSVSDIHFAKDS